MQPEREPQTQEPEVHTEPPPEESLPPPAVMPEPEIEPESPQPVVEEVPVEIPEVPQRRYSVDWDPSRHPPPKASQPEAAELPSKTYIMSSDRSLFQAPIVDGPPLNMYYRVPSAEQRKAPPKPIFPWETCGRKPSRVFAEDPTPDDESEDEGYSARGNAWDDNPDIDRYMSSLPLQRKTKVHVLFDEGPRNVSDPPAERKASGRIPIEVEHPSMSVTPAPIARPTFWSAERDAGGSLPTAKGVPDQNDWDPAARLTELTLAQEKLLQESQDPHSPRLTTLSPEGSPNIPQRKMPDSSSIFTASPTGKRSRQVSAMTASPDSGLKAVAV